MWPIQNDAKINNRKMTETLAHGYSPESTQRELSKNTNMKGFRCFFKYLCILVFWKKVASALGGLNYHYMLCRKNMLPNNYKFRAVLHLFLLDLIFAHTKTVVYLSSIIRANDQNRALRNMMPWTIEGREGDMKFLTLCQRRYNMLYCAIVTLIHYNQDL